MWGEMRRNGQFQQFFSYAFPKLDWYYWTCRGIGGKVKTTISE